MLTPCDSYNYPSILSLFLDMSFPLIYPFILLSYLCGPVCGSVQVGATPSEARGGCWPCWIPCSWSLKQHEPPEAVARIRSPALWKTSKHSAVGCLPVLVFDSSVHSSVVCIAPFIMIELSFSNSTQLEQFKGSGFTSLQFAYFYFLLISAFFCLLRFNLLLFLSSFLTNELLILF